MDKLSKELNTFLVQMGLSPESVSHQKVHYMEHLLSLLEPDEEEAVVSYYGLFGKERMSLSEIADKHGKSDEDMMAAIDASVRRLAVTPEWQSIKQSK